MLARINFLFSVSILTLLLFYFAGRFALLQILSTVAPYLAPYFIAAYALAALMLMVLVVAKLVIRLDAISSKARSQRPALLGYVAQVSLCLAHLCVLDAIATLVPADAEPVVWWPWLAAPVLYLGGIILFVIDMRQRALRAPG